MNIDTDKIYGTLMAKSIENYIKHNILSENLVKTIRFVRENLYLIDENPRPATLTLYLEYNLPSIKQYSHFIWDHLQHFQNFELQLKD